MLSCAISLRAKTLSRATDLRTKTLVVQLVNTNQNVKSRSPKCLVAELIYRQKRLLVLLVQYGPKMLSRATGFQTKILSTTYLLAAKSHSVFTGLNASTGHTFVAWKCQLCSKI